MISCLWHCEIYTILYPWTWTQLLQLQVSPSAHLSMPVQIPSSCHRSRIKTTHSKPAVHLGIKDVKMWSQDLQGQKFWGSFVKFWVFGDLQKPEPIIEHTSFQVFLGFAKGIPARPWWLIISNVGVLLHLAVFLCDVMLRIPDSRAPWPWNCQEWNSSTTACVLRTSDWRKDSLSEGFWVTDCFYSIQMKKQLSSIHC